MWRKSIVVVCLVALLSSALPVAAGPLPSRVDESEDRRVVSEFVARDEVADVLQSWGLTDDEVDQRLSQLSDEDVRYLASHVEQIQSGGRVPDYIWILLGIFLGVLILSAIF